MGSAYRHDQDEGGARRRPYVASLLWRGRPSGVANDNRPSLTLWLRRALLLLAGAALLIAAALWVVAG